MLVSCTHTISVMFCFVRTYAEHMFIDMNILKAYKLEVLLAKIKMLWRVRRRGNMHLFAGFEHT